MLGSEELRISHVPPRSDLSGTADTDHRKPILACVAAANRLSEALLAAERDGYPVMMAYEGVCCRGMSDGLWHAVPSVRESVKPPAPAETVHVSPIGTFASRRPVVTTPATDRPSGSVAVHTKAIERAFAEVSCRLLVSWMPGRCLDSAPEINIAVCKMDEATAIIVKLYPVKLPHKAI